MSSINSPTSSFANTSNTSTTAVNLSREEQAAQSAANNLLNLRLSPIPVRSGDQQAPQSPIGLRDPLSLSTISPSTPSTQEKTNASGETISVKSDGSSSKNSISITSSVPTPNLSSIKGELDFSGLSNVPFPEGKNPEGLTQGNLYQVELKPEKKKEEPKFEVYEDPKPAEEKS